jgi:hypothetical protein
MIIDFDFIVFITISLLVHHPCTFSISSFNLMVMSDMELDEKCIVVSSAYKSDILWSTYLKGVNHLYTKEKARSKYASLWYSISNILCR